MVRSSRARVAATSLVVGLLVATSCGGANPGSPSEETVEPAVDLEPVEDREQADAGGETEADGSPARFSTSCPDVNEVGKTTRLALEVEHASDDPVDGLDCAYQTDPADPYGISVRLHVMTEDQLQARIDDLVEQGVVKADEVIPIANADEGVEWAKGNIAAGCGPDGSTCEYGGEYDQAVRVDDDTWYTVYGNEAFDGPDGPYRFLIIDAFARGEGVQCHVVYSITKLGTELDIEDHARGPVAMAQHACGLG